MPRETAAAAGWSPGDAVVFSPASTSSKQASSSNGDDYNARQPLAAVKTSKQAFEKREKPRHHQSTLSPWAKAAWQPGMRVLIATTSSSSRHSTCTDGDEHRSTSRSSKGKQRQVVEDENRIGSFLLKSRKIPRQQHGEHIPFQTSNIYEDPSPKCSPHTATSKKVHSILDDSLTSVKAVISDNSCFIDPDSSIEFLGQRSSPHSRALRHLALAQANLLEVSQNPAEREHITATHSGPSVAPVELPYRRRHIPFKRSPSPPQRSFSSESSKMDKVSRSASISLDWDDPVVNPSVPALPNPPDSDSSDLPDIPFQNIGRSTTSSKTSTSAATSLESSFLPTSKLTDMENKPLKTRPKVDPSKMKKLRAQGRQQHREAKEAKEAKKQAHQEKLKNKYRVFSYDKTSAPTPKVWYYRGLASGETKFIGCDTRLGFSADNSKPLEEVLADLKGPLGWDLEWETWTWNADYTDKEVGKAALFQIGDKNNVVLFQIQRRSSIPSPLLDIIEDPSIVKLGVQIKGDARKISRDYRWPTGDPILPRGLLDLSDLARHVHPSDMKHHGTHGLIGLQRLVAIYLEAYLEKGEVRTSKWENQKLDAMQRKYAANDIFASVQLYQRIIGHAHLDGKEVDFESLIYDSVAKADQHSGMKALKDFKPRKAKPVTSRAKTHAGAPTGDSNSNLTPRVHEAWEKWWADKLDRGEIAEQMGVKPMTVVTYIIKALCTDTDLPYDKDRLRELIKDMIIRNDQREGLDALLAQEESVTAEETDSSVHRHA